MPEAKIEVITYSGYRGEETPRAFILRGKRIEVVQILRRWLEEGVEQRTRKRCFEVRGSDGREHRVYYDEIGLEWFSTVEGQEV